MGSCYFANGVYYVRGAVGATLYDSRNGFLYHLDRDAVSVLSGHSYECRSIIVHDENLLSELVQRDLVTSNESACNGDIHDLAVEQRIGFAWIEVTTGCNLRCIHCYGESGLHRRIDMSIETYAKIIDELFGIGVEKIQLIGGEPMVMPLLKDFLDYANGKFAVVEVYTNGTLITPVWVDYFKRHGIRVAMSVYSYEPLRHDFVTNESGSWARTNEAIRALSNAGVRFRVRNVLMNGVSLGDKNTQLYTLNGDRDVVRMVGRANARLLSPDLVRKRLITKRSFSTPVKIQQVIKCVSGHNCFSTHLYFSVDGSIYPCVMERRISHGNVKDAPLANLLRSEILKFGKDCVNECRDCEFRYFCFDCRPDAMGGRLTDKPWYCTYHPLIGQWEDPEEFIRNLGV